MDYVNIINLKIMNFGVNYLKIILILKLIIYIKIVLVLVKIVKKIEKNL